MSAQADHRPLVLVAREQGRLILAALDAAAAGEGLTPGLPLAEARALVPDLASAPVDPAGDAAALARLAEWCTRYTPWAALDGSGCDAGGAAGILLDITGCAHLFGGADALLADLVHRIGRLGFAARAALAESAGAAWALARFATADGRPWTVAPPGAARAALAPLPPAALRLGAATVELMARLGLRRIGDLYDLPPATLAPRFGPSAARRLAQALGTEAEPISPRLPVPPHLVRRVFAEPIVVPEDIARGVAHLAGALARRLEAERRGARRLELGLYRVDGTLRRLAFGTSRASRDPAHLARLFAEHLDKIDPGFGIEVMTLAAPVTQGLSALQLVLSDRKADRRGERPGDLAALIDRLGSRLGLDNVVRPAPRESHVPERAVANAPALEEGAEKWLWQISSAALPREALDRHGACFDRLSMRVIRSATKISPQPEPVEGRTGGPATPNAIVPPSRGEGKSEARLTPWDVAETIQPWAFRPRPVRLLPRPEPVEAIALLPDHPPARFRWRRLSHTVVRAEGPERIAPEWWLEPAAAPGFPEVPARDYFRIEAADGRRYWLYRAAGRWFLHGLFA